MIQQRKQEDYLKTTYLLQLEETVRGSDITGELSVKRPTVSASNNKPLSEVYREEEAR